MRHSQIGKLIVTDWVPTGGDTVWEDNTLAGELGFPHLTLIPMSTLRIIGLDAVAPSTIDLYGLKFQRGSLVFERCDLRMCAFHVQRSDRVIVYPGPKYIEPDNTDDSPLLGVEFEQCQLEQAERDRLAELGAQFTGG